MFGTIVILIVAITSIWIYLDATKNKIGKIENEKSMFNISAGEWAAGSLLLWIVVFPAYLIKRKSLVEKAKEFPVEAKGRGLKTILLASIVFGIIILIAIPVYLKSISNDPSASNNSEINSPNEKSVSNVPVKMSFDTTNKSISLNGNIDVAMNKINDLGTNSVWDNSKPTTAEILTKSPYSAIGNLYKIIGKIYKVEELPPGGIKGHWSELLLLTDNPNSPLGATTIDFLYNGDITNIQSGQIITCSGFFVGTFESDNSVGGKVEAITLVGNDLRLK